MLVVISGKQGSGKSTLAKGISKYFSVNRNIQTKILKFADPLYTMHDSCLSILKDCGIERDVKKDGVLLQLLGTEWGRNTISEDIWVNCLEERYKAILKSSPNPEKEVVIVDDCRLKNELERFPDAFKIRLLCDESIRKQRCGSTWRHNVAHTSETGLDDSDHLFNIVIDTGITSKERTLHLSMRLIYERTL